MVAFCLVSGINDYPRYTRQLHTPVKRQYKLPWSNGNGLSWREILQLTNGYALRASTLPHRSSTHTLLRRDIFTNGLYITFFILLCNMPTVAVIGLSIIVSNMN